LVPVPPVPAPPVSPGEDECESRAAAAAPSGGTLECEYFTTRREKGIVLHNAEWGSTLFTTPDDTP
jgi:hypothetical protein